MTPRRVREVAFQMLFALDAQGEALAWDDDEEAGELPAEEHARARALAVQAYAGRHEADQEFEPMAPAWPLHRRPAVDRAILRLAWHEMVIEKQNPRVVINEAVELAKRYAGDRSPGFINALLDNVLKRLVGEAAVKGSIEP